MNLLVEDCVSRIKGVGITIKGNRYELELWFKEMAKFVTN